VPIPADLDQADRRSIVGIIALLSVTGRRAFKYPKLFQLMEPVFTVPVVNVQQSIPKRKE
jgi:hypothetical protein